MKATTVKFSDVVKYSRLDAGFFVTLKDANGPYGDAFELGESLERAMTSDQAREQVAQIYGMDPKFVYEKIKVLSRNKDEKDAYKRALNEYPHLSLALLLNNLSEIDAHLESKVEEAKKKLQNIGLAQQGVIEVGQVLEHLATENHFPKTKPKPKL